MLWINNNNKELLNITDMKFYGNLFNSNDDRLCIVCKVYTYWEDRRDFSPGAESYNFAYSNLNGKNMWSPSSIFFRLLTGKFFMYKDIKRGS